MPVTPGSFSQNRTGLAEKGLLNALKVLENSCEGQKNGMCLFTRYRRFHLNWKIKHDNLWGWSKAYDWSPINHYADNNWSFRHYQLRIFFFFCIIKRTNANFKLFLLDIRTTSTEHSVSKGHFCSFHPFSWWHGKSMAKLFDLKSHRSCSTNCILFCLRKKNQNINCAKSQRYVLVRGTITHRQRNIMLYWLNM